MYKRIKLDYKYDDLEPFFDAKTMELHYENHHKGYETKLNNVIEGLGLEKKYKTIELLMENYQEIDNLDIKTSIREFGGGLANHNFFFDHLKVGTTLNKESNLYKSIIEEYESFENFQKQFKDIGMSVFGSGWVWLVKGPQGSLKIIKTFNQDTVWFLKLKPILALDLWEHSYYIKYNSDRSSYIDNYWNVVDWDKASEVYEFK